jgi:hypothetical protein
MRPPNRAARPTTTQGAPKPFGDGGVLWPDLDLSRTRCKSARLQPYPHTSARGGQRVTLCRLTPPGGWPSARLPSSSRGAEMWRAAP